MLTERQPIDNVVIRQARFREVVRKDVRLAHEGVIAGCNTVTVRDFHRNASGQAVHIALQQLVSVHSAELAPSPLCAHGISERILTVGYVRRIHPVRASCCAGGHRRDARGFRGTEPVVWAGGPNGGASAPDEGG